MQEFSYIILQQQFKFNIENQNTCEIKNKDKKYNITANFSSIITLIL